MQVFLVFYKQQKMWYLSQKKEKYCQDLSGPNNAAALLIFEKLATACLN